MKFKELLERNIDIDVGSTLTDEVDCALVWDPEDTDLTEYCKEKYADVLELEIEELEYKYAIVKCDTLKQERKLANFLTLLAGYVGEEEYYSCVLNKNDEIHCLIEYGTRDVKKSVESMSIFAVKLMTATSIMSCMPYCSDADSEVANIIYNKILSIYEDDETFTDITSACFILGEIIKKVKPENITTFIEQFTTYKDLHNYYCELE